MKKKEEQLQEAFHKLVWLTAEMIDQGIISDTTISRISTGTLNFTEGKRTMFYQQLYELLETEKTEAEILHKGIAIRDSLSQ
ncbi:MAG: hypothetical protein J6O60_06990 [Lachnospiraceae bacterium]|nr:hypothetical protein [Lachnospiraceae bacterium]